LLIHTLAIMQTNVQKWGNSLGVRIPRPLADQAQISEGSAVEIEEEDGVITIRVLAPKEYALDELVEEITDENRHEEVSTGSPVGNEVW
jgi:antitoxin MazE